VGLATALWQSAGRYPDAHGIFRPESQLQGAAAEGSFGAKPEAADQIFQVNLPDPGSPRLAGFAAQKQIVDLDVVGSSPITRPNICTHLEMNRAACLPVFRKYPHQRKQPHAVAQSFF
jgi:hypothetical protein